MTTDNQHTTPGNNTEEHEIDLIEVIRKLWRNRGFILKTTLVFIIIGLFVALFSPKEYTAGCTMVPQTSQKTPSGSLSGLAAMAGINLGTMGGSEVLSPNVYPIILKSIPFQKDLMSTPIIFEKTDHPITILEYYTDKKYQPFNLLGAIKKYTIGLPGVILSAIRGKKEPAINEGSSTFIQSLSADEQKCSDILKDKISLNLNSKDGYVTLTVRMPEASAAAQLAERAQQLLHHYITTFKIEKVQSDLDFIQNRHDEAQRSFESIQTERATFRDANKNIISAKAQTEQERLDTRYNLELNIYTELAKQLEQAKISVKETTPILTIINPVSIPFERSKPKRGMILVLFTFVGGIIGIGGVLILPFIANLTNSARIEQWIKE